MSNRSPLLIRELSDRDRRCFRCRLSVCDEDDPRCLWRELSERQKGILLLLVDGEQVCSLIAERASCKKRTVLNALTVLKKKGFVINDGARIPKWSLTEEGKVYVDCERQAGERAEARGV